MRRRVKTEKNLRKACEKWLRSELKSRVRAARLRCQLLHALLPLHAGGVVQDAAAFALRP